MKDKIEKLPKWAQKYISNLESSKESLERQIKAYADEDTDSNFFQEELLNGKFVRKNIQGHRMSVVYGKIKLDINLIENFNEEQIRLQFDSARGFGMHDVFIQPQATNSIVLKAVKRG